jgi:hypothetical protein
VIRRYPQRLKRPSHRRITYERRLATQIPERKRGRNQRLKIATRTRRRNHKHPAQQAL